MQENNKKLNDLDLAVNILLKARILGRSATNDRDFTNFVECIHN